jgi:hypothetical protein
MELPPSLPETDVPELGLNSHLLKGLNATQDLCAVKLAHTCQIHENSRCILRAGGIPGCGQPHVGGAEFAEFRPAGPGGSAEKTIAQTVAKLFIMTPHVL